MMKFSILFFVMILTINVVSAQKQAEADRLLLDMVASKGIVGITAAYSNDGKTTWSNSAGFSCKESQTRFTDSTLTRTASIAKSMTAVAIMQLVEQNLLDLDVPIQQYLPEFPKKEQGEITPRQLLSHTSGLSQYQSSKETESVKNYPDLAEAIKVFQDRPLLSKPGTAYYYTTYGYVLLGRIIEKVSGVSFEAYMQANIWDKAEMHHTGVEKAGTIYANKACLYHKEKNKAKPAEQNDLSNRVPGGGFYSTLDDMLKFGNALLDGKLISESTLEQMRVNHFVQKEGNPYGLGWFFYGAKPFENAVIGHSGEQTGSAGQLMIIPQYKIVVVVLSNTSGTWKDVVTFSTDLIKMSLPG